MLVVVDSPTKVGALRVCLQPGDKITDLEFPLFNRFARKVKKIKDVVFPDLKPASKPEIVKLEKLARLDTIETVLGVFDDNEYGRVQARDLAYALSDINVTVEIKYVCVYTREAFDAVSAEPPPDVDVDVRYILNRLAVAHITQLLESYVGADTDFNLSWQQAYVLGLIHSHQRDTERVSVFKDSIGRRYCGSMNTAARQSTKAVRTILKVPRRGVLDLVDAGLDLDAVYPTLERLRGVGAIPVSEIRLDDPQFGTLYDQVDNLLDAMDIRTGDDLSSGYTVVNMDPRASPASVSDACKNLYNLLRRETLLAGCEPAEVVRLSGSQMGLDFEAYVTPDEPTWLGLADIQVFPAAAPGRVSAADVRDELRLNAADSKTLCADARDTMSARDLWSACTWLVRKSFVIVRDKHWFLSSRGCLAVKLLGEVLAVSLTKSMGDHIKAVSKEFLDVQTDSAPDIRQEELLVKFREYLEEQTRRIDPTSFWADFCGSAQPNVSASAAWFDQGSQKYGMAWSQGDFVLVPENVRVFDPCPVCRADTVDTKLDTNYVTAVECSCGLTRPAVSVLKEQ